VTNKLSQILALTSNKRWRYHFVSGREMEESSATDEDESDCEEMNDDFFAST
jgi:hypothetical protein